MTTAPERHIVLELTDEAREYLAAAGYDPQYGARPLKRAIQKELETPLGKLLLKAEVGDGQDVIVSREGPRGALKFIVEPGEASKRDAAAAA